MISRIIWSWPITFILIAPHAYYGLELGAVGLAISMVATQFLTVNIFIYYISRFINIKIKKLLFHQISSAIIFLVISYGCSKTIQISTTFDDLVLNQLSNLFLRGVVYFLLTILVLYTYPKILALERSDVNRLLLKLRSMTAY